MEGKVIRSRLMGVVDPSENEVEVLDKVLALLRCFMKDALIISGRYAHGLGRNEVTASDMKASLMYCARTFFERSDHELQEMLESEKQAMMEEDDEEDDEEDYEEDDEEDDEENDEESDSRETLRENEGACEPGESTRPEITAQDKNLVRHVDSVVSAWSMWEPTDPVHQLIKRAIDNT